MTDQEAPKIEFPCDYPIKVMVSQSPEMEAFVVDVMRKHDSSFSTTTMKSRESKNSTFISYTVTITATGTKQLAAIFEELKKSPNVKMVL